MFGSDHAVPLAALYDAGSLWPRSVLFYYTEPDPTPILTLSLHDALPIFVHHRLQLLGILGEVSPGPGLHHREAGLGHLRQRDRKSTRLNSSHVATSYAVFCLKKKSSPRRARASTTARPRTTQLAQIHCTR